MRPIEEIERDVSDVQLSLMVCADVASGRRLCTRLQELRDELIRVKKEAGNEEQ